MFSSSTKVSKRSNYVTVADTKRSILLLLMPNSDLYGYNPYTGRVWEYFGSSKPWSSVSSLFYYDEAYGPNKTFAGLKLV